MAKMNLGRVVGRSAYEEAVRLGYKGPEDEWIKSLEGDSAYEAAVKRGYTGSLDAWLTSLKGKPAYQSALDGGFTGTEQEFNESLASIGNINAILDFINGDGGGAGDNTSEAE